MSIYQFKVTTLKGEQVTLEQFKDKVLLIVNTASKCRFTYQFEQLQQLYLTFDKQDFEILGFPCNQFAEQEPGTSDEAAQFCRANYGVSFPMFAKINVNGVNEDPLFRYLKQKAPFRGFDETNIEEKLLKMRLANEYPEWLVGDSIKWNFTKFLIDKEGTVVNRFEPSVEPTTFEDEIRQLL
ncbi:glutathione peroxidase [Cerasibacillus quisquiliarum]|uniref:Glutathione peroxidase n=1 Tax=Cerasibacillus quisquiliarum TaxID=227865 RepID=A0A511UWZ6_9BACI|nr:glutathione peroxidase [Cerasibacillus quisquiliarum]MBB5145127.1 glutathione peroxidase [Cerasibacillus quisquiliarum]GEN29983.1 glutathione peroxidase [Cerasibacillus quisquiliarum]